MSRDSAHPSDVREARAEVARLVAAYSKPGWAEGTSLEEAISNARDRLFNWELDPAVNPKEFAEAVGEDVEWMYER